MKVRERLNHEIQGTSDTVLEQVLDFLLFLKSKTKSEIIVTDINQDEQINNSFQSSQLQERPIWEIMEEVADNLPEEIVANLPTDGSTRHDYYHMR